MNNRRTRVAIIGSGRIGIDLMLKALRSNTLELAFLIGRSNDSEGLRIAQENNVPTSSEGIDFLKAHPDQYDIVFDATSALAHAKHNEYFSAAGKLTIDLTPSRIGYLCVPAINLRSCDKKQNISLGSCGVQASVPFAHALKQSTHAIEYLEVVSTISSASAGLATRENIDHYLTTTEYALSHFSGAKAVKAVLNINPAKPGVVMQTTLYARATYDDIQRIRQAVDKALQNVQHYVPGLKLVLAPTVDKATVILSLTVHGSGDYLPTFAGNLDIINCAAIAVANRFHLAQGRAS